MRTSSRSDVDEKVSFSKSGLVEEENVLDRTTTFNTINIDNYHGIHLETVLVYLSLLFIGIGNLFTLVGAGAV